MPTWTLDDIEVGRFAVRTFNFTGGELCAVARGAGFWLSGTCEATCQNVITGMTMQTVVPGHVVPVEECRCGIYACLTVEKLREQYRIQAAHIIAVLAAEGRTILGPVGLRTARARIVAYWTPWFDRPVINAARHQFPDAAHYSHLNAMLEAYNLPITTSDLRTWVGQKRSHGFRALIATQPVEIGTSYTFSAIPGVYNRVVCRGGVVGRTETVIPLPNPVNMTGSGQITVTLTVA